MLLLLVDTAGSNGSVLLARSEGAAADAAETEVLGSAILEPRKFSIQLISAVAEILGTGHSVLADVDAFVVISGPGSFTGLRVGLSAVKAIAEAMVRPVIALSRLAVLASIAQDAGSVHAVLDAGRGEFYHGIYRDAGWTCVAESLETLQTLTTSIGNVPGLVVASEPAVIRLLGEFTPNQIPEVSLKNALPLALAAWRAGRFRDVALLDANYLRRSDAVVSLPPSSQLSDTPLDHA